MNDDNSPEIESMDQMWKKHLEWMEEISRQLYIEEDAIVFNVGYPYHIALSRCDTPIKILEWVDHLSEKAWITTALLKRFIFLATEYHKIKIHRGA